MPQRDAARRGLTRHAAAGRSRAAPAPVHTPTTTRARAENYTSMRSNISILNNVSDEMSLHNIIYYNVFSTVRTHSKTTIVINLTHFTYTTQCGRSVMYNASHLHIHKRLPCAGASLCILYRRWSPAIVCERSVRAIGEVPHKKYTIVLGH